MGRFIPTALGIAVIVIAIIVVVDVFTEPEGSNCILDDNIILPDRCFVSGCEGEDFCPPETTRPYLFFWQEAASCPDGNFLCPARLD